MYITIGLTGAMGCGKSTASKVFEQLGAKIIDADKLSHKVLNEDENVIVAVKQLLGDSVYDSEKKADRSKIASIVFADKSKLSKLEAIIHPAIHKHWQMQLVDDSAEIKIAVIEMPLLFEKKLENNFDICLSVHCSESLRRKRLCQRGMTPEQILERDAFQLTSTEKAKRADIVLFNETDINFLKEQTALIVGKL